MNSEPPLSQHFTTSTYGVGNIDHWEHSGYSIKFVQIQHFALRRDILCVLRRLHLVRRLYVEHKIKFPLSFMCLVLLLFCQICAADTLTPQEIAKRALDATVLLVMKDSNGHVLGTGSGFFVQPNQIATNYHVIEGAAAGTAKRVGKEIVYTIEGLTAMNEEYDLALLRVSALDVQPLPLGDSEAVKIGDAIYVAGSPQGIFEGTFSDGIISGIRESSNNKRIQMTAPISPGSSGGPVLNNRGEVIGVSVTIFNGGQNLNFAVPSKDLKTLAKGLMPTKPLAQGNLSISAETYFRRGNTKFRLGLYQAAIVDYDAAIRLKPDYAFAYITRGWTKENLGQHFDAIADYDIAIRLEPRNSLAYTSRGNTREKLGQLDAAILDYDTAIRLKPDDAYAYVKRGNAKENLAQHFAAIQDYDTAINLQPDNDYAYLNRGRVKEKLGQYDAAIKDYDAAIRLKPDNAYVHVRRGWAKKSLGRYFAAIQDYDTAIRLKPNDAYGYISRGSAKQNLGQHLAAITDYDTAIRLKPDDALAYHNRGWAKECLGQFLAAIADYDTAIRFKPDDALTYYNRGMARYNLKHNHAAKQDFRTALKLVEKTGDESLKTDIESAMRVLD